MKASTTLTIATFILLYILSAVLGWTGRGSWDRRHSLPPQIDTVWLWRPDTNKLVETKPAGTVTAKLPKARPSGAEIAQNANLLADSAIIWQNEPVDTLQDAASSPDSVAVEIPIEQRTYEGENYRAVVQGFRPELVSIDIRQQTVTVTEYKRKWWSVTIGPQLGYGFTPAGWQPYAGIGITAGISF